MRSDDILLWLSMSPGVGAVTVRKLRDYFGSWERVWEADEAEMTGGAGVRKDITKSLAATRAHFDPYVIRRQFEPEGIRYLSQADAEYPEILHGLYDPPAGLFVLGTMPATGCAALAVVGARTLTSYGRLATEKLVTALAESGLTIVSGLARGIDTAAHGATLKAGGKTIAVLGSGLLQIYPRENVRLAHSIAEQNGAVVSEWPPHTPGKPQNFPIRNRIISGLAQATLVVEAGEKSGSLITADQALEQGRDVYAVPGPITSPPSIGTNRLIQQGAKLILTASDILEDYGIIPQTPTATSSYTSSSPHESSIPHASSISQASSISHASRSESSTSTVRTSALLTQEAQLLLQALGHEEASLDDLHRRTNLPPGLLHSTLLRLQLQGTVAALPGNRFLRVKP